MPVTNRRDDKYSVATGIIFVFNLIVGNGALALPGALQNSGWLIGVVLIVVLGVFSCVTVTFVIESLATANAVAKKSYEGIQPSMETPLVSPTENSESNPFEITEKYEIGQIADFMSPKWCQIIVYACLCVYLFGDLAIYAVVIGKTSTHVWCTYADVNGTGHHISADVKCWADHSMSKLTFYRLSVTVFILLLGPFLFFNVQKTKFLQIFTACLRWLAFLIMLIWSIEILMSKGKQGNPPYAEFDKLPTLFGSVAYSFICQHSIPGLIQPIRNKKHVYTLIGADFTLVTFFNLALGLTAVYAFKKVEDLYTLNFWEAAEGPGVVVIIKLLAYYLAWFPVFTLSTSFPIVGITLRNNLRNMILGNKPPIWYYDRLLFPIVTILPPSALAIAVSDLHFLLGIVGSYCGALVQYTIPCLLVVYARKQAREFDIANIYASPFKGAAWVYIIILWGTVTVVLISINYVMNWK